MTGAALIPSRHGRRPQSRSAIAIHLIVGALFGVTITGPGVASECPSDESARFGDEWQPFTLGANERNVPIDLEADNASLSATGVSVLSGDVTVRQGERMLRADEVEYDPADGSVRANGRVGYSEPGFELSGTVAELSTEEITGSFSDANFKFGASARGQAGELIRESDSRIRLRDVTFTTCPEDKDDWALVAPEITLDTDTDIGTARGVRMEFKSVPFAYVPFMTFPLSDKRKSGFLTPDISTSDRNGTVLGVPYYFNLAPNYDLTLDTRWLSRRGPQVQSEFRYLMPRHNGAINIEYLPDDETINDSRTYYRVTNKSRIGRGWTSTLEFNEVGDGRYFEDLGGGFYDVSITHLPRNLKFEYLRRDWNFSARLQDYQTLDDAIDPLDRPYRRLPQLVFNGTWPGRVAGFEAGLGAELVNFDRSSGATGWRLHAEPEIAWPFRRLGYFVEPRLSLSHTSYSLQNLEAGVDDTPTTTAPVFTLDSGLVFERDLGPAARAIQTLEPRVFYTHIPFRDQRDVPVFDTGALDFNLVQLFRADRFIGYDRLGDTDQLSIGVTTRITDMETGRDRFSASLGQQYYLSDRAVRLPGGPAFTDASSDIIAEIGVELSERWNADVGLQWQPESSDTQKAEARLQYRGPADSVVNLGYRFRRDQIEQTDISFVYPVGTHWNLVGRWNYSLREDETLDRFLGAEYETCCWAIRLISRRFINTRDGDSNDTILFQLELKGLSSVGRSADELLERGILGYDR